MLLNAYRTKQLFIEILFLLIIGLNILRNMHYWLIFFQLILSHFYVLIYTMKKMPVAMWGYNTNKTKNKNVHTNDL